jgi:hypothetical protein
MTSGSLDSAAGKFGNLYDNLECVKAGVRGKVSTGCVGV